MRTKVSQYNLKVWGRFRRLGRALDWAAGGLDAICLAGEKAGWQWLAGVGVEGGWEACWPRRRLDLSEPSRVMVIPCSGGQNQHIYFETYPLST